ncbi:hypothetical protein [Isoptericola cucumis]|uniref:Uncharacterized protein n=1 Tax=Isoptericola cucumis TaxID=1776856 RepID=A0ABQ2B3U2_9MICO|nr:hypothetical protein [Isoptericola cucumis]GGI05115.1 hypothetical protein GCM10007368_04540 [Isoptericola cucumis]
MSHRHAGQVSAALLYGLVAAGGVMVWVAGAGLLMTFDPTGDHVLGWACVVVGAVGLLAATATVVSLLRTPRIVAHDPSGGRWSIRATPVPLRIADSARLAEGSHGEALAAQVVRAATRRHGARSDTTQAVMLLRQVLALAERSTDGASSSAEPVAEAEWRQVRAAVIDFALRASDHPPQPVSPTPPPQRAPAPW